MNPSSSETAITFVLLLSCITLTSVAGTCSNRCGSLDVKYPLGTGPGCGDPRFRSSISCLNQQQLIFSTHTGSYPIKSIDYSKSTITILDPGMSTCSFMKSSPNFGLDWTAPFQLDSSIFVLLHCNSPSSLVYKGNPLCDTSNSHICFSLYSCPGIVSFGVPPYSQAAASSCCVYSPVNLGPADDINLNSLHCSTYTSILSFGESPTDPTQWEYGVRLKYNYGVDSNIPSVCNDCERSNGVCGYAMPRNTFVCACQNGVNTTSTCYGQEGFWSSSSSNLAVSTFMIAVGVWITVLAIAFQQAM
ncbi:unnamed protein product [Victoria cruziana]